MVPIVDKMKKDTFDFESPFEVDTLLEVRTSGMKNMPGLKVLSGIDKKICPQPMKLTKLGLQGDEHDMTFHGGPDKAILGCKLISDSAPILLYFIFPSANRER